MTKTATKPNVQKRKKAFKKAVKKRSERKYAIADLIYARFKSEHTRGRMEIMKKFQISRPTLNRDETVRKDQEYEIPQTRLLSYAEFFKVPVESLTNG